MKFKNTGRWFLIIIAFLVIWYLFIGNQSILQLYRVHLKVKTQQKELIQLHEKVDSLSHQVESLLHDTLYMEKIAREKLGMAKKNETVYKFIQDKK